MSIRRSVPGLLAKGTAAVRRDQSRRRHLAIAPYASWVCLLAVVCVLLSSQPPADADDRVLAQGRRAVVFGPPEELAQLAVTKDCRSVASETAKVRTTTLTFSINPSGCFIYAAPEKFDYLAVEDLEPFTPRPWNGEPQLPMKTFIVRLDTNAEVYGVEVVGGTYREVQQPVHIVPVPWGNYIPNEELYRTNSLFPGRLLDYERGNDNQRQHVFVRFYPLQYVPGQRKAFLVTKATLKLYWSNPAKSVGARGDKTLTRGQSAGARVAAPKSQCVIICPEALQKEASRLSQFHSVTEGIRSSVVTTEAIAAAYQSAPDPPFNGYTNRQLEGWASITNYNHTLAKKIVAYLRDQEAHPRLVYVTLLGDGLLVPPSYYYYASPVTRWTPTDFFYASPDYDFVPNYRVGRLSVNDAAEAAQVVDKIIRWHKNARWDWFKNVCLAGGRLFDYMTYTGEIGYEEAIRQGLFDGMNVKRFYESAGRLEPPYIEPVFTTLGAGIFCYAGHASVDSLWVSSKRIEMKADNVMRYSANDRVPVVFADACDMGAFDLDLMNDGCHLSFGEALLKSPAGGIAVFGASRITWSTTLSYFNQEHPVVAKVCGMQGLVHYALESYRGGADTLGKLSSDALYTYVANNRLSGSRGNMDIVFAFVLLGDPALKIPMHRAH
jgi:Peptidase family C25/Propeptide_C25